MSLEQDLWAGFSRALGVPTEERIRSYVRQGRGDLPGPVKLLAWDANSIHAFVFDTTNATGIRGASDTLRGIDRQLAEGTPLGLIPEQVLFTGGGSGLAVVAPEQVEPALNKLHHLFTTRTLVATATAISVDLAAGDHTFGERVQAAGRAMALDRLLTGPDAEPAVPFFAWRCEVCGRRAAAAPKPRGTDRRARLECQPCHDRIESGKKNVHYQEEPSEYSDIADGGGQGFLAVVYLDGNGVGKALSRLESPLAYATFSRAITEVVADAVEAEAERYGISEREDDDEPGRYQLPICGGDDVVAILPGEVAVPWARDLLGRLEETADAHPALSEARLGAAAGIAIGHAKFPIRHLLAEAEALLRRAKRRVYADRARSALDFSVITDGSPRAETVEAERWAQPEGETLLSGRPYTLPELKQLSTRLSIFRSASPEVGRSQLYTLRRYGTLGRAQLRNHVLYQIGRHEAWQRLIPRLAGGGDEMLAEPEACVQQLMPVYGGREVFDVGDLLELFRHFKEVSS